VSIIRKTWKLGVVLVVLALVFNTSPSSLSEEEEHSFWDTWEFPIGVEWSYAPYSSEITIFVEFTLKNKTTEPQLFTFNTLDPFLLVEDEKGLHYAAHTYWSADELINPNMYALVIMEVSLKPGTTPAKLISKDGKLSMPMEKIDQIMNETQLFQSYFEEYGSWKRTACKPE